MSVISFPRPPGRIIPSITATAPATSLDWSAAQQEIFDWFASGEGDLVVRARAGTGKTTTILEGVNRAQQSRSPLLCAFNRGIATELQQRLRHPTARAKTLHGIGWQIIRDHWAQPGKVGVDPRPRARQLTEEVAADLPHDLKYQITVLHTGARERLPFTKEPSELETLACTLHCFPDIEDTESDAFKEEFQLILRFAYLAMVAARVRAPVEETQLVDYADMIYLPLVRGWAQPTYDLVVVDEAQDLTDAQLRLAMRLADGRVCLVGDDRQAIYGFRGAGIDGLDRLKAELEAAELGLTCTYRCGRAIVKEVQSYVPAFTAAEGNPDGVVRRLPIGELLDEVQPGDVVLSRTNAPLVRLCFAAWRQGIPASMAGRDIAAGLRTTLRTLEKRPTVETVADLVKAIRNWEHKQREKIAARAVDPEIVADRQAHIADLAATLLVLTEDAEDLEEVHARLRTIFAPPPSVPQVIFSTVHKAKGLEWPRVFVLEATFRDVSKEERNIRYVAITRAIRELVYVEGED